MTISQFSFLYLFMKLGNKQQLITESVLTEETCQIRDIVSPVNTVSWPAVQYHTELKWMFVHSWEMFRWFLWLQMCRLFFSYTLDCLQAGLPHYIQLCEDNIYSYEDSKYIGCAFFKEVAQHCGNNSYIWNIWRSTTKCSGWTVNLFF